MTRRALVVASQTYGLKGCDADAELMRSTLGAAGFECDVRTGGDATRAGILDGVEHLVAATAPGDAALVYYSGHGGRIARPDAAERRGAGRAGHFQFIVPFDIDDSTPQDFRGLLSEEMTILQRRLTDAFTSRGATPNVTLVLDCCHSGYLARDPALTPRFVDLEARMFPLLGIRVRAGELARELDDLRTNPHAVRLVACQEEQSAFERPSGRGGHHGVLTDALATVLADVGERPLSWVVVGDAVRRAVQAVVPDQHPDVEGPATTRLFSTEREPAAGPTFALERRDDSLVVEAASILGLTAGDEVALLDADGREVGRTRVDLVRDGVALLAAPTGVVAVRAAPIGRASGRHAVVVAVGGPAGDALREAVDGSVILTSVDSGPALASVREEPGGLMVVDDAGAVMLPTPCAPDEAGRTRIVERLATMAHGRRIRQLPSGVGPAELPPDVEVRFATVAEGTTTPRPRHGERLAAGTAVSITLANGAAEPRYVWVFDVCLAGRVTMLTASAPSGTLLAPAGSADDVRTIGGAEGLRLYWPDDLPPGDPSDPADPGGLRPETIVVVVADRRQDLTALAAAPTTTDRGQGLDTALDRSTGPPLRYRVETIDLLLTPAVATGGGG